MKFVLVQIKNSTRLFLNEFSSARLYNAVYIFYSCFLLFFFSFISFIQSSHAQNNLYKNNNTWYFGNKAGINFNTIPPSVLYDGELNTQESCASVSDKNSGRILFYTDGKTIWDSTHHPMPHGTGLLGRHDAEQVAVIPYPENSGKYFILTSTHWNGTFYSIVDMSLNNGKGDVDTMYKNIMLIGGWNVGQVRASDRITFTKHANKTDYWAVTHLTFNDSFYVYKINKYGVQPPTGFKVGANETPTNPELAGVLKFNKTGNLLVNCQPYDGAPLSRLQGFNFNNSTGIIESVKFSIENIWFPYGVEFSPNNRFMYVSHPIINTIEQYDLNQQDIPNSAITIHTYNTNYSRVGQMQLGPDNRIYVAQPYTYYIPYRFLGIINMPDSFGTTCNFVRDAIDLYPNASFLGLPQVFFDSDFGMNNSDTCLGNNLLQNGDFEDSMSHWGTDLFVLTPECGGCNGWFYIANETWCGTENHTINGNQLFSSSPTTDTSKRVLYQTVNVKRNTDYKFSAWGMAYNYNAAIFSVIVNDKTIINSYSLSENECTGWEYFSGTWNSGEDTTATIVIKDVRPEIYGNDFGLDDIFFQELISCANAETMCADVDTFNCRTLAFLTDSSRFCVPVILSADSGSFVNNGFHFCMNYDSNFVKPTDVYVRPNSTNDFTVVIDSITKGKVCVSISNVQYVLFNSKHEIDLGCIQFVLKNESFNSIKQFDYLSFQVVDGCNNNLQIINAWLTEDNKYWKTEDGKYWKLED